MRIINTEKNDILKRNVIALLELYKTSIDELIQIISSLSNEEFLKIRDFETTDDDCKSIKSIVEHVIFSGYIYTFYYTTTVDKEMKRPLKENYGNNSNNLTKELTKMYQHCESFFHSYKDLTIEETDNSKKILTKWGQLYDIDQLFEHSIVHILRHKRQIKNFLMLNNKTTNG